VVIFVCVTTAPALDACLAGLDRSLSAGTRVLVADDGGGDPRVAPLAQSWCERTRLSARFLLRDRSYGRARHRSYLVADHAGEDLVILDGDAVPAPGWLDQLQRCAKAHPDVATLSTWSNGGGLSSFPRFCEDNPLPAALDAIAQAAAGLGDSELPDLPTAQGPCLYLRGEALRQLGGWDSETYVGFGAEADYCHRAASMRWRNALCPTAFVGRSEAGHDTEAAGEDLHRLLARWPDHQEGFARFLLSDTLRPWRERLQARLAEVQGASRRGGPQGELFE